MNYKRHKKLLEFVDTLYLGIKDEDTLLSELMELIQRANKMAYAQTTTELLTELDNELPIASSIGMFWSVKIFGDGSGDLFSPHSDITEITNFTNVEELLEMGHALLAHAKKDSTEDELAEIIVQFKNGDFKG